jgi:hypothetical protein
MLILLDCRPLQTASDSEKARFIFSSAAALTGSRGIKWLFLVDQTWQAGMLSLPRGADVLKQRALPGRAGWKFWYDWQMPRLVKKHKAALVMLTGGVAVAGLPVPQCLWMPESANPKEGREAYPPFYLRRLKSSLQQAEAVYCFSERDREWLAGRMQETSPPEKFIRLMAAPDEGLTRLTTKERETGKTKYAAGKEYFLADITAGTGEEVVSLLKAFSLFKKRQLSNMQLILAGSQRGKGDIEHRLETYKYRQDVRLCVPSEQEEAEMRGAAYALLLPVDRSPLGVSLLDAWKAGVPVIVKKESRQQQLAGEAALIADIGDPGSFAGQLMSIYKDEGLRQRLIGKGFLAVEAFTAEMSAAGVWQGIDLAVRNLPVKS